MCIRDRVNGAKLCEFAVDGPREPEAGGRGRVDRRARSQDSRLRREAHEFRSEPQVSATCTYSRWTTERMERQLGLSLEPAGVRKCGLRCLRTKPARLDRIWATVRE